MRSGHTDIEWSQKLTLRASCSGELNYKSCWDDCLSFLTSTKQDKEPVERHNAVLPESPKTATRIFFCNFGKGP